MTMAKKLWAWLLVCALLFTTLSPAAWAAQEAHEQEEGNEETVEGVEPVEIDAPEDDGEDVDGPGVKALADSDTEYVNVTTANELMQIAEEVNTGADLYEGKTVRLEADITLPNNWEPIGKKVTVNYETATYAFLGNFDGNGRTITSNSTLSGGLFGIIGDEEQYDLDNTQALSVSNLTVYDVTVDGSSTGDAVGAVANESYGVEYSGITLRDVTVNGYDGVGGITGYAENVSFTQCTVDMLSLTGVTNIGALAGEIGWTDELWQLDINTITVSELMINAHSNSLMNTGGLVGSLVAEGGVAIDHVTFTDELSFAADELDSVGGLTGELNTYYSVLEISNIEFAKVAFAGEAVDYVGGLTGTIYSGDVTIGNVSYQNALEFSADSLDQVGGLVGSVTADSLSIAQIEFKDALNFSSDDGYHIGGLGGSVSINPYGSLAVQGISFQTVSLDGLGEKENLGGLFGDVMVYDSEVVIDGVQFSDRTSFSADQIDRSGGLVGELLTDQSEVTVNNIDFAGISFAGNMLGNSGGLFGVVSGDSLSGKVDLEIENVQVSGPLVFNGGYIEQSGGIIGYLNELTTNISEVGLQGGVQVSGSSMTKVGGLIGEISRASVIVDDISILDEITIDSEDDIQNVGGLIGYTSMSGKSLSISDLTTDDIIFSAAGDISQTGGTIGFLEGIGQADISGIEMGSVTMDATDYLQCGGIIGQIQESDCILTITGINAQDFAVTASGDFGSSALGFLAGHASVESIAIDDVTLNNVTYHVNKELSEVGGILGYAGADIITIADTCVAGVRMTVDNENLVYGGGLIGNASEASLLTIEGTAVSGGLYAKAETIQAVGGLIGTIGVQTTTDIQESFFSGGLALNATDDIIQTGGFVGNAYDADLTIDNAYVTGDISLTADAITDFGSFVGTAGDATGAGVSVSNVYYAGTYTIAGTTTSVNLLLGNVAGGATTSNAYYDLDYLAKGYQPGRTDLATGLTTLKMTRENASTALDPEENVVGFEAMVLAEGYSAMTGFDFDGIWQTRANDGADGYYPQLQVFAPVDETAAAAFTTREAASVKSVTTDAYYYLILDPTTDGALVNGADDWQANLKHWFQSGTSVTLPSAVNTDGETALNWKGGGDTYSMSANYTVTKDNTLVANWDAEPTTPPGPGPGTTDPDPDPEEEYTVTFHWNDGRDDDVYEQQTVTAGGTATVPVEPELQGYVFGGWYEEKDCATEFDFDTEIYRDWDVYALWDLDLNVDFTDFPHYAYLVGYDDGYIRPEANISRAEVATIFFRLITDEYREEIWSQQNDYSDVALNNWFNNAVSTMSNDGIFVGYEDGTFRPNDSITRAELATVVARMVDVPYDGPDQFTDISSHWARESINIAANLGWVEGYGDGTFRPNEPITRAKVAALLNRVLERQPEDEDDLLPGMIEWPDNEPGRWFYLDIQEATNSHEYEWKDDGIHEHWTILIENRDWTVLEKPNSRPGDIQ